MPRLSYSLVPRFSAFRAVHTSSCIRCAGFEVGLGLTPGIDGEDCGEAGLVLPNARALCRVVNNMKRFCAVIIDYRMFRTTRAPSLLSLLYWF